MSESLIIAIAKAAIMESMAKMRNPGISYNELLELSEIIIEAGETIKEAATDKILAETPADTHILFPTIDHMK